MTAVASPAPAAPIRVAAGTTAGAAVREAGLPQRGEVDAIVVVKDAAIHDARTPPDPLTKAFSKRRPSIR